MDVDWSKTNQGRKYYNRQSAVDFVAADFACKNPYCGQSGPRTVGGT